MEKIINIPFLISGEFVDDVILTALTGGINYWCDLVYTNDTKGKKYLPEVISAGGTLILKPVEEEKEYELNFDSFCEGFKKYVSYYLEKKRDLSGLKTDSSDIDGEISDTIIQFALFGEIIYG